MRLAVHCPKARARRTAARRDFEGHVTAPVLHKQRQDSAPPLSQPSNKKRGAAKWAGPARPSSEGRPVRGGSGCRLQWGPASPTRLRQKGDTHVSQKVPPMSSCAALEPAPASASRRPRCLPSGCCGPPARASSIRVLVCSSLVAAGGGREGWAVPAEGSGRRRPPPQA